MFETGPESRPKPPLRGDEWQTLTGVLDHQRATFAWKCSALDAEQLGQTFGSSSMTLGGLLKHLAFVEDDWFGYRLGNQPRSAPWAAIDWERDVDWDWHSASGDSPRELRHLWEEAVQRSGAAAARAYRAGGLEEPAARGWPDGSTIHLRWILTHMIEEYARHNGHADLVRESIDGLTGE